MRNVIDKLTKSMEDPLVILNRQKDFFGDGLSDTDSTQETNGFSHHHLTRNSRVK